MGIISADRSDEATLVTLLLTIPYSIKVMCNGFISSDIEINISRILTKSFRSARSAPCSMIQDPKIHSYSLKSEKAVIVAFQHGF